MEIGPIGAADPQELGEPFGLGKRQGTARRARTLRVASWTGGLSVAPAAHDLCRGGLRHHKTWCALRGLAMECHIAEVNP